MKTIIIWTLAVIFCVAFWSFVYVRVARGDKVYEEFYDFDPSKESFGEHKLREHQSGKDKVHPNIAEQGGWVNWGRAGTIHAHITTASTVSMIRRDEVIDPKLIDAIIQVESGGNPEAVSEDKCVGMMQLSYSVMKEFNAWQKESANGGWHELTYYELFKPDVNIAIGTWYLSRLKNHYLKDKYTVERMLASYNGGPTRMLRLLREGKDWQDMPHESVEYVKKVMKEYRK